MRGNFVVLALVLGLAFLSSTALHAQQTERRIAFVVGNGNYSGATLPTAANDAGLIAQTLQAAGFDVVGARDLDEETLRQSYREFLQKAAAAGPDAVALVYLSGYGLQYEGENYFVPAGAKIAAASDVPIEAIRFADLSRPLAAVPLKARILVFDAARENPFAKTGAPLAGGLALADPDPGALIAFNAAPGTVAPAGRDGAYGAYGQALAEMMREGGLSLDEVFDRVRLRVNDVTKGSQVPWDASKITAPFHFFERAPDAPAPVAPGPESALMRSRPIRDFPPDDAYAAALERDSLQGYEAFLAVYPDVPMAPRVRALLAARREAITWRQTTLADSADAYWSYLRRYPRGPHAFDARRRLEHFSAALEPPPSFPMISYDVPPPPPAEIVYVERPVLVFSDPYFDFAPPPPPPIFFLPPPPPYFIALEPPPPPIALFVLPAPFFVPLPVYINPPPFVAPPPNNIIFNDIHQTNVNTTIINNPGNLGAPAPVISPGAANGPGARAAQPLVSLPSAVQQKAIAPQGQPGRGLGQGLGQGFGQGLQAPPRGGVQPPSRGAAQPGQPLPGAGNQPLPPTNVAPPNTGGRKGVQGVGVGPQGQGSGQAPLTGAGRTQTLPGAGGQPLPPITGGVQGVKRGQGLKQGPKAPPTGAGGGQPPAAQRLQNAAPRPDHSPPPPLNATQERQRLLQQQGREPKFQAPPQQQQLRQVQPPPQQQLRQVQPPPQQQLRQVQPPPQQQLRQVQPPPQQQLRQVQPPPQQPRQVQAPRQQQPQVQPKQQPQQQPQKKVVPPNGAQPH